MLNTSGVLFKPVHPSSACLKGFSIIFLTSLTLFYLFMLLHRGYTIFDVRKVAFVWGVSFFFFFFFSPRRENEKVSRVQYGHVQQLCLAQASYYDVVRACKTWP